MPSPFFGAVQGEFIHSSSIFASSIVVKIKYSCCNIFIDGGFSGGLRRAKFLPEGNQPAAPGASLPTMGGPLDTDSDAAPMSFPQAGPAAEPVAAAAAAAAAAIPARLAAPASSDSSKFNSPPSGPNSPRFPGKSPVESPKLICGSCLHEISAPTSVYEYVRMMIDRTKGRCFYPRRRVQI